MATTGIVNGYNLRLKIGGVDIGYSTTCKLDLQMSPRSKAHKDIGTSANGWQANDPGVLSWSASCAAFFVEGNSFATLIAAQIAGTVIALEFSTDESGDQKLTGNCYITGLPLTAEVNEDVTYDVNFIGDGALTVGTVV